MASALHRIKVVNDVRAVSFPSCGPWILLSSSSSFSDSRKRG